MNWVLDAALAAIILVIIIINTCKGFKTVLNLLVTVVSFGAAYFFGPDVGRMFVTDMISGQLTSNIETFLNNILSETIGEVTTGELISKLPETLTGFIERLGINLESILSSFAEDALVGSDTISEVSAKIAQPISNVLATVAGCILVFVGALLVMLLVKALIELLVKLPVLKQAGYIFGFAVGVVNAFLWMIVICTALGIIVEGGFLGENHYILEELTESSYIYGFFDGFSLLNLFNGIIT